MRIAALVAVSLLLAGCFHSGSSHSAQTQAVDQAAPRTSSATAGAPTVSKPSGASTAPAAGAAISEVMAWIETGRPADPNDYHNATRDGVIAPLGNDIALTANAGNGAGKVVCMTDSTHTGGALTCLVDLTRPPPRPETAYGDWKAGWVDFTGTNLQVGATRGDPGPFINGNGTELANGDSLTFGDYRCRADESGLLCVNYAHHSAAQLSSTGIEPFGCLQSSPPPEGVGLAFSC